MVRAARWRLCDVAMSKARTAQCALLYKGWSGERRRREGHEVKQSVADVAVDGDCNVWRKMVAAQ